MSSEVLRQVRVLDPVAQTDEVADVWIEDGILRAIAPTLEAVPDGCTVRDCTGLILGPGLVDLYSHSGEPGFESRETLDSLRRAAAAGGFTRVALLPDTTPALDNPAVLELAHQNVQRLAPQPVQLCHWGAVTVGAAGAQLAALMELAEAGVVGFSDGQAIQNLMLVRQVLDYVKPTQKPVALWCCDRQLASNGVAREGATAIRLGLPGIPVSAETTAIAAVLELVAESGTPVHLMRLSTARGVTLVREARQRGLPVTASITWMHGLLSMAALGGYDPHLRLDPPLGNPTDQEALLQGLEEGVIDAIAVDHSPYTYEEKTVAFAEAPPGAIGLELALPLLWPLVELGKLSPLTLWRSLSTNPARCLQQPVPTLAMGQSVELVLFDPQASWTVNRSTLRSLAHNTPCLGKDIRGRVVQTWLGACRSDPWN